MRMNRFMRLIAVALVITVCFQQSSHGLMLDNVTERNEERYRSLVDTPEWDCLAKESLELSDADGSVARTASLSSNISRVSEGVTIARHASNIAQNAAVSSSGSAKNGSANTKTSMSTTNNKKTNMIAVKTTPKTVPKPQTATAKTTKTSQKSAKFSAAGIGSPSCSIMGWVAIIAFVLTLYAVWFGGCDGQQTPPQDDPPEGDEFDQTATVDGVRKRTVRDLVKAEDAGRKQTEKEAQERADEDAERRREGSHFTAGTHVNPDEYAEENQ